MTPKTQDQVKQMADKITNVIAETCNLPKDVIWIVFETIPQEAWSVSGKLLKDPTQKDG
jgi:phenylpyruvate tautomerase PptA (4-oxalocrotonate tautomerase family)